MGKKNKTPDQKLEQLAADIEREITHWKHLNKNGGNDPFWPDGTNMNLTRNHVIYDKRQIKELCDEHDLELPAAFYLPTPPEVNDAYMANLQNTRRVERLRGWREDLTTKKQVFDDRQTTFL